LYLWLALPTREIAGVGNGDRVARTVAARGRCRALCTNRKKLTVSGPYAWTRNPLYFGSFLLVVGFAVASHSWVAAALIVGYYAIFYPAVMRREEGELRRKHGEAFDEYAARVPLFFPAGAAAHGRLPRRRGSWATFFVGSICAQPRVSGGAWFYGGSDAAGGADASGWASG
jgi:hypothetical protein